MTHVISDFTPKVLLFTHGFPLFKPQQKRLQAVCKLRRRLAKMTHLTIWRLNSVLVELYWKPLKTALLQIGKSVFMLLGSIRDSLKGTASLHLRMDGWNTIVSFWGVWAYFQGRLLLVSGRVDDFLDSSESFSVGCSHFTSPPRLT